MRPSQTLICDMSFVGRLEAAPLAISVVTIAETRVGYRFAGWGAARIESAERDLRRYISIPVGCAYRTSGLGLRAAARTDGIALSDNDLWIAPCGGVGQPRKDAGK